MPRVTTVNGKSGRLTLKTGRPPSLTTHPLTCWLIPASSRWKLNANEKGQEEQKLCSHSSMSKAGTGPADVGREGRQACSEGCRGCPALPQPVRPLLPPALHTISSSPASCMRGRGILMGGPRPGRAGLSPQSTPVTSRHPRESTVPLGRKERASSGV